MLVNVYNEDQERVSEKPLTVREVLGEDATEAEIAEAHEELRKAGRAWVGGGAAPLFLLMTAERVR